MLKYYEEHPRINTPTIEYKTQIDSIEKPVNVDGIYYSLIAYSRILEQNSVHSNDSISNENIDNKIKILKKIFGENNIIYDKKTEKIYFKKNYYAFAILKINQLHWKFIFVEEDNYSLINKVIPKKIIPEEIQN